MSSGKSAFQTLIISLTRAIFPMIFSSDGPSPAHSPTLASAFSRTPSLGPATKSRFRLGAAHNVSLLKQVLQHTRTRLLEGVLPGRVLPTHSLQLWRKVAICHGLSGKERSVSSPSTERTSTNKSSCECFLSRGCRPSFCLRWVLFAYIHFPPCGEPNFTVTRLDFSGSSRRAEEVCERTQLLDDVLALSKDREEEKDQTTAARKKSEENRAKGIEMRDAAMKTTWGGVEEKSMSRREDAFTGTLSGGMKSLTIRLCQQGRILFSCRYSVGP